MLPINIPFTYSNFSNEKTDANEKEEVEDRLSSTSRLAFV